MKKLNRLFAIVLVLALALSLAVPVAAAEPQPDFTAKLMKLLRDEKSPYPSDVYVYPYSQTYDATVIKGGSTMLQFKRNRSTLGSDYFCFGIYKGSLEEFEKLAEQGKEPELVEVRIYEMRLFSSPDYALATAWAADSRYSVGDYTMVAFVMSAEGDVYEQYPVVAELHVVNKQIPATEMVINRYWNDQIYEADPGFPENVLMNSTVCYEPYALPLNNTSDRTITVTSSRPDVISVYVDAGLVYMDCKGIGRVDVTITYGNLKETLMVYSNVTSPVLSKFELVPTQAELCTGMTDKLTLDYAPTSIPVSAEWYSDDPDVATVKDGVVTAVGPGTAKIRASASLMNAEVTYTVSYHELPEGTPVSEQTATKPAMSVGHCSVCGQDDAVNIIEKATFSDTDGNAWYADHVDYVYAENIMNGSGSSTFSPDRIMTRAELVTVLYRIAGSPEVTYDPVFVDVPAGEWYSDAIIWASQNKVVNGVGNGRFAPTANITREQIATILYRYTQSLGVEMAEGADLTTFPDYYIVSGFALEGMSWAVAEGLITGTVSGGVASLSPLANASRAQLATIISRYQQMFQ